MSSRDEILSAIRYALKAGPVSDPPPVLLREASKTNLIEQFKSALETLSGNVTVVNSPQQAEAEIGRILNGRSSIRSTEVFSRDAIAMIDAGITSADYALADTGSLVFFTESHESRLLSVLPPCHIAVIDSSRIVASLDDLFKLRPLPSENSSAMVIVTGPSRTADIEMRLVRGVHGPGEIHVIILNRM